MWIRNTSRYPDDEVAGLVRLAAGWLRGARPCINVKNLGAGRGPFRGRAYDGVPCISNAPARATHLVTIGLGPPASFTGEPWRGTARSPEVAIREWREALVYVAAHEAMHVEQFRRRSPRSEVECNRFAAEMLGRWRMLDRAPAQVLSARAAGR